MFEHAIEKINNSFFPLFNVKKSADGKNNITNIATGWLISEEGHFITNYHAIQNLESDSKLLYMGNLPNSIGKPVPIEEIYIDKQCGIYLGFIKSSTRLPAKLASARPYIGSTICMTGYLSTTFTVKEPDKFPSAQIRKYYVSSLVVDRIKSPEDDSIDGFLCHDSYFIGMEGGPVMDTAGNVVGLILGTINRNRSNTNNGFILHNSIIQGLYKIIQVMQTAGLNVRLF